MKQPVLTVFDMVNFWYYNENNLLPVFVVRGVEDMGVIKALLSKNAIL